MSLLPPHSHKGSFVWATKRWICSGGGQGEASFPHHQRGFLAGLLLLLALPLLWGEFCPHRPLLPPCPGLRAGLSVCPGGTEGLKPLPAAGELGLLELGLCHVGELGVCPSDLLQGTGQRVQVPVVLVPRLPQVQDDGGGAALGGEEGEIPARKERIKTVRSSLGCSSALCPAGVICREFGKTKCLSKTLLPLALFGLLRFQRRARSQWKVALPDLSVPLLSWERIYRVCDNQKIFL